MLQPAAFQCENDYLTQVCNGSEADVYARRIDFVHHCVRSDARVARD